MNIACGWMWCAVLISYLMWKDYNKHSLLYKLDIYFARGSFGFLLYFNIFDHTNSLNKYTRVCLPLGVISSYVTTCVLHSHSVLWLSQLTHSMFRFIGIWWAYLIFHQRIIPSRCAIISLLYWTHIFYYKYILCPSKGLDYQNNVNEYYNDSCELMTLITYGIILF